MEDICEPIEKLQVEDIDPHSSSVDVAEIENVLEENVSKLIQDDVQEKNISITTTATTGEEEHVQEKTCADVINISDKIDTGFCTENLANDVGNNNMIQGENEICDQFTSSHLVTTTSSEVDSNQIESGICDSLCQEENSEKSTQLACEQLLSIESLSTQPESVDSGETGINQLKGEVCDSTATEENLNSLYSAENVESAPGDASEIVSSVPETQSSDHGIKRETEQNISDACDSFLFASVSNEENITEENELTSAKIDDHEQINILNEGHVIVNDNILIPVQGDQSVIHGTEGHFIVQEDGTMQQVNESEMPHNGLCVSNFESENTLLVIEEIESHETEITAESNESISTVECTSSDIIEEQISSLVSEVNIENKETHEKDPQEQSSLEVKNTNKKTVIPVPEKIITESGKSLKIPAHVLGRNIDNPVNDIVSTRKVPPKPRLGVKIPYRNLTSQIVSKQEIANVIMERSRMRNAAYDPPVGGDVFFAKKLTQRLARKLAPNAANTSEENKNESKLSQTTSKKIMKSYNTRIENDSDLLAILEGDGDDMAKNITNSQKQAPQKASKLDPETEKLIALKQLQQLPKRKKTDSSNSSSVNLSKEKQKTELQVSSPSKNTDVEKNKKEGVRKDEKTVVAVKENTSKEKMTAKDEVVESRFASNVPLKTYARKRKNSDEKNVSLDDDDNEEENKKIETKTETNLSSDTYITKSSRVIKKKIIWDPDEAVPYSTKINVSKQVSPEKRPEKTEKKYDKSPEKKVEKSGEGKSHKSESKSENKIVKHTEHKVEQVDKVEKKGMKLPEKKILGNKDNEKLTDKEVVDSEPDKKKKKVIAVKKKYKYRSEVDKLLMDEGAINMMYEVRNDDQSQCSTSKRKSLVNKANEIKNELESSSESPKSLRKKNSPSATVANVTTKIETPEVVTRKKSRDSIRSSVHTPPASPSYTFPQHAEASRIIRRHSSSSFDSEEEDEEGTNNIEKPAERITRKRGANSLTVTKTKKMKRSQAKENLTVNEKNKLNEEMSKNFNNLVASSSESIDSSSEFPKFKKLSVTKIDKLVRVTVNTPKKTCIFSVEVFAELCKLLDMIEKDDSCNTVVLNSSGISFCHGIDYKELFAENEEVCKKKVTEMVNCVYDFLKRLISFPKVIVAGVRGDIVGIGVIMLPLFDMVLASDETTFSIPCGKLGCIAEGSFVLSHFKSFALASELLFASQTLICDEAVQRGLITRTVWREKFMEELNSVAHTISENSKQSTEATKKLLRRRISATIEEDIKAERNILIEQWLSEECQKNFSGYRVK